MKTLILTVALMLAGIASQAQTIATRVSGGTTATNSFIAASVPSKVFLISGYSATTQYIMVFQTNAVPANGTVAVFSVPVTGGQFYSMDFSYYGADLDKLTVCNSTTANTLTIGAADCTFQTILRR